MNSNLRSSLYVYHDMQIILFPVLLSGNHETIGKRSTEGCKAVDKCTRRTLLAGECGPTHQGMK